MADNTAQITESQQALDDLGAGLGQIKAQMDRLQTAMRKANQQIGYYSQFQNSVGASLNGVSNHNFSGTNRNSAESNVTKMSSAVASELKVHQANIASMQATYNSLSNQSTLIGNQINDLNQAISVLVATNNKSN